MGQPAAHTSSLARHHLIGLGFWQAWQMAAFCSSAIIDDTPHSGISLKTLAIACTTLGYLVVMAASEKSALRPKRPFDLMGSSFSMAFGTLVLMFAPYLSDPSLEVVALVFSLTSISFGNASLLMMWGELWGACNGAGRKASLPLLCIRIPALLRRLRPPPSVRRSSGLHLPFAFGDYSSFVRKRA